MNQEHQITLKSIAGRLGVSTTTVSRVLNGRAAQYRISPKTEAAVLKLVQDLDYKPNQLARGLRMNQTKTLGLIIPNVANAFFAKIASHIEKEARKRGYSILLSDSQEMTKIEEETVGLMRMRHVDGLIVSPVGQQFGHLKKLYDLGMPMVIIDRYHPDLKIPYVISDNYQGAFDAVEHLIEHGHHRIACIQGSVDTTPNQMRVQGYRDAFNKYDLPVDASLIVGDSFGDANGYIETKMLMRKSKKPTAIFAVSNLISIGVLRALAEENMHVPEDISLISFDEHPYTALLATPMSTVAQPQAEMGKLAVKLLMEQIDNPDESEFQGIVLPAELVLRESVRRIHQEVHL